MDLKLDLPLLDRAMAVVDDVTFCTFSSIDGDGFPQARMMLNLKSDPNFEHRGKYFTRTFDTYLCTALSSEKVKHVQNNPNASVYYNKGYDGVLLIGRAEIVQDQQVRRELWKSHFQWNMYYKGQDDPEYAVIKFTAEKVKFYSELEMHRINLKK